MPRSWQHKTSKICPPLTLTLTLTLTSFMLLYCKGSFLSEIGAYGRSPDRSRMPSGHGSRPSSELLSYNIFVTLAGTWKDWPQRVW